MNSDALILAILVLFQALVIVTVFKAGWTIGHAAGWQEGLHRGLRFSRLKALEGKRARESGPHI